MKMLLRIAAQTFNLTRCMRGVVYGGLLNLNVKFGISIVYLEYRPLWGTVLFLL